MLRILAPVHADERHETFWAAATIFLVLTAHSMLETSRDALFLSHLPTSQLPWVYLGLAALGLLATRFLARSAGPRGNLWQLIVLQLVAAAGTFVMFMVLRAKPAWALYALYIWGGLASTVILIRFWLLLSDRFTIGQAKRLFPLIAAGALLGSLVGYGVAGLLTRSMPPSDLLAVSASLFLFGAGGSVVLWRAHSQDAEEHHPATGQAIMHPPETLGLRESVAVAVRHAYVRRVALLLLTASLTVTLGDFIFKRVVAQQIDAAHLGTFLATSYFVFDLIALVLLFTAVVPFVRSRGVSEALALEPLLLCGGGILLTVTGGLVSVVLLRGVDGALRWSLHKTATELLYVPLSPRLRCAVKALSDIVSHRCGQALGSLVILGWLAFAPSERMMGPLVIACTGLWIYLAASLRQPYLDLFRDTLSQSAIETGLEFPDLDLASLETLIAALSSTDEHKVLGALDLLEQTDRAQLIPALILYHPSSTVVRRALEIFTAAKREDFLPLAAHLFRHPEAAVRAATVRACAVLQPDVNVLQQASESESPSVAATALVALAAKGIIEPSAVASRLEPFVEAEGGDADDARRFIALAMRDHPLPAFAPLLERLALHGDIAARREAVRAIGAARDARHLPLLVGLLATRELREATRAALLAFGEPGLDYLHTALADLSLPRAVRIHLPRTISRFPSQEAADMLLRHLPAEPSGMVRYKILRGLGRMIAGHPHLHLAPELVDDVVDRELKAIVRNLHWQVVLEEGAEEKPQRRTIGYELLIDLLQQKETLALERLFRVLGLRHPVEDVAQIYAGLQSPDAATRSNSRELLHGVLPTPLRAVVLGLTEEVSKADRLASAHEYYAPEPMDYETLLIALVGEENVTLCSVAAYHAAEIGLTGWRQPMEARQFERNGALAGLRQRSLELYGADTAVAASAPT